MPVYKDEKRKTWYCVVRYKDWSGEVKQHKKRGFAKQSEAKAYERDFVAKSDGALNMSFDAMLGLYMKDCAVRLRETTYINKEYLINSHVKPFFGKLPIIAITPSVVRQWQNEMLSHKPAYAPTYLKTIHNQLSAIFNYAVRYYGLKSNPAARCGAMGKKNAEEMQFWTLDEFRSFMVFASDKPASKVMFEILYWTGMREGELLALTLGDVDFSEKKIRITKSYASVKGVDTIQAPKTPKSRRSVTVPDFLLNDIKEYASRLYDYSPEDRLFICSKQYLRWEMIRGCGKSGVKKIRIHDLRHSHASLLINMNVPILLISERLGHENIETTLVIYGHLYPDKHIEVAQQLGELNAGDFIAELLPEAPENALKTPRNP